MSTALRRIATIGNFPPRLCGIATFTMHTRDAIRAAYPELGVDVYAMDDPGVRHDYGERVACSIRQDEIADYTAAAHRINESAVDAVLVQHEYGIFGGASGAHLLRLLDRVEAPAITVLHTVLEQPSADQRAVIEALARRSSKLIVMAEKGRDILERVHGVAREQIVVVPHGAPDRPFAEPEAMKLRFGFEGRRVLLTFGLLSPNKGIETMIRALPALVARHPDLLYVVLGATHPHLVVREGEAYRKSLVRLAAELGVADHVRFVDAFVEEPMLIDYLETADVYVTPYLNEAQITSGTLAFAVALGKAVVSTPYWHAAELLGDGTGLLVPFGDSAGFSTAIGGLLDDRAALDGYRRRAWEAGRGMLWEQLARTYVETLEAAAARRPVRLASRPREDVPIEPNLTAIERMTDSCGMIQHGIFKIPDRDHGYCVDDNARALMLMHMMHGGDIPRADELATIYAAFVQFAWNGGAGRFRNFMTYERTWLEAAGSEDSFGRSLWAIGVTATAARRQDMRRWALHLFDQVAPHALELESPRTWAFALLGAEGVLSGHPSHKVAMRLVEEFAGRLSDRFHATATTGWTWFESVLGYDNTRMPEAMIRAGRRLDEPRLLQIGLDTLAWIEALHVNDRGFYRPVGSDSFGREYARPLPFDQQPLEAWASLDAAAAAFDATGDEHWRTIGWRAYRWYLGDNDIGLPIVSVGDGGCYDGLMRDRVNLNQGAESVLAFQFANCAIERLGRSELVPEGIGRSPAGAIVS